jgi:GH15 family glucan-1,4-alpha-glucosidase
VSPAFLPGDLAGRPGPAVGALALLAPAAPWRDPARRGPRSVGIDGTIDWYCCPRLDSPSIFAAILDADHGGLFRIAPEDDGSSSRQLYLPDTNVLLTRFLMPDGVGEVQDFMPAARSGAAAHRHRLIRRVLAVRGHVR